MTYHAYHIREEQLASKWFRAYCTCGWCGNVTHARFAAEHSAKLHLLQNIQVEKVPAQPEPKREIFYIPIMRGTMIGIGCTRKMPIYGHGG